MATSAEVYEALLEAGRAVTLRRPGSPNIDVTCLAVVRGYRPEEMHAGVMQGDRVVIISNQEIASASWPRPIVKGDRVIIDEKPTTVVGCDERIIAADVVKHTIQVRG